MNHNPTYTPTAPAVRYARPTTHSGVASEELPFEGIVLDPSDVYGARGTHEGRRSHEGSSSRLPPADAYARRVAAEAEAWLGHARERSRMRDATLVRKALSAVALGNAVGTGPLNALVPWTVGTSEADL